jgi:hypothetical protein
MWVHGFDPSAPAVARVSRALRAPGAALMRRMPRLQPRHPRGQSLVEFAISFPVLMLMILFGVDFGRVFLGWVQLNGAVREAANFAAINPAAWTSPYNYPAQTEYERLITAESDQINCELPETLPAPTFPTGTDVGSPTIVAVTCRFSLITPLIGNILGDAINVSASASFPIRSGLMGGTSLDPGLPSFSAGPSTAPTAAPTSAPTTPPTTMAPTTAPTATPVPQCFVPDFINTQTTQATRTWTTAGFSANNLTFNPLVPPNYKIKKQSISAGTKVSCSSTIIVAPAS